jgi:hypothetical protein
MPGGKTPGPSVKNPKQYEALKDKGFSKTSAAKISNAAAKRVQPNSNPPVSPTVAKIGTTGTRAGVRVGIVPARPKSIGVSPSATPKKGK